MPWRRILVWIAGVIGALVLLVAALVLSAPLWVDAEGVKARVNEVVAQATGGHAHFEHINLHYFPLPGVTISRLRFSQPGLLDLEAQSAAIDIDLIALFAARIEPGALRLAAPKITVQIPEPTDGSEPFSIEDAEQSARGIFAQIAKLAPSLQVAIDDGSVSLQAAGRRPLSFDDLHLRAETERERIDATVSCSSNLWDRLTLKTTFTDSELTGNGTAELVGFRAHDMGEVLRDVLGQDEEWPVREAVADANLQWQMKGLSDVQAEGNLSSSKVSLRFGERHLDLLRPTIDASAQLRNGTVEISVRQLVVDQPRLNISAKLTRNDQGAVAMQAQAADVDLVALLATAAQLAPEISFLVRPPVQIERGTITSAEVRSEAATLAGLAEPEALQGQFELAAVDALAPEYDVQLRDVGASGSFSGGQLAVHSISGHVGKSLLRDGAITVTLSDEFLAQRAEFIARRADHPVQETVIEALVTEHITLSADAVLSLDLAESLVLAKRVVREREVRRELDQIKQLAGRADVRAIATLGRHQPEVQLDVSAIQLTARHAAVPFAIPVQIKRGTVRYAKGAVHAQNLEGTIGRTTFKGIGARVGIKAPYTLSAGKGSAQLALEELMRWAGALPELSKHLSDIEKVTGTMSVSVSKLEGPLRSPDKLRYALAASPQRVSIDAPKLGPRAELDGGKIDVSHTRIRIQDVKFSTLDASLKVAGTMNDYRNGLNNLQVKVDGFAGPKSLEWLRTRAGLREDLRFAGQLHLSGFNVQWQRDGEFAAHGKIQVTDGPAIDIAMRGSPKRIDVENIGLRDELSDVTFGGSLEGTRFTVRFKGKLAGQSVARIFARMPIEFGELHGDLHADSDWTRPGSGSVEGELHGSMIGVPLALQHLVPVPVASPVTVEKLSLVGHNRVLSIKTATVATGDSRLEIGGSVDASGDRFLLDLDVRGDTVVIPLPTAEHPPEPTAAPKDDSIEKAEIDLEKMTVSGEEQLTDIEAILEQIPVTGQIRINISELNIGDRELKPFIANASLKDTGLVVELQQVRLCNILLTGGLTAEFHGHASLNVEVHTHDAPIEQSIPCLTKQSILITGLMDVDANLVAAGTGDEFFQSARVTYALSARDGAIRKFEALAEVVDTVNESGAVKTTLPAITESGLQYKAASAKGSFDLHTLRLDEAVLDIDLAKIVAQGSVDIDTRRIDATVLVAPFKRINKIIGKLPILGRIFGGSLLAVPVGVSGTIDAPVVVPLSPVAVTTRVLDIFTNTLKLPADLVNTVSPEAEKSTTPPPPENKPSGGR